MIYNNYAEICDKALKQGSFIPLFRGEQGLNIPCRAFMSDCPTDWEVLITLGVYELFSKTRDNKIQQLSFSALKEMLNPFNSACEIWCAYNTYLVFVKNESKGTAPFHIINSELTEALQIAILHNKDELSRAREFRGQHYPNGLFGDINRSTEPLKKYGLNIQNSLKRGG